MTGVLSGYLAAAGFSGPRRILDGRRGYYATVASDRYRPDELLGGLGDRWHLVDLSFKPYPACRWIHPVLDAIKMLRDRHQITPAGVAAIEIAGFWELEKLFLRYEPVDLIDAQFSLPYTCAQVILGTPPGSGWFAEDRLRDPDVLALAARVSVTTDPEVEAARMADQSNLRAKVTIRLTDGRVVGEERAVAHGHPSDPMTEEEAIRKFVVLASPQLGDARARQIAAHLLGAEGDTPAGPLFDAILSASEPTAADAGAP
jgi:2-methylcitrate dehydratase PrpD